MNVNLEQPHKSSSSSNTSNSRLNSIETERNKIYKEKEEKNKDGADWKSGVQENV